MKLSMMIGLAVACGCAVRAIGANVPADGLTYWLESDQASGTDLVKGEALPNAEGVVEFPMTRGTASGTFKWSDDTVADNCFYAPAHFKPTHATWKSVSINNMSQNGGLNLATGAGLSLTNDFTFEFYAKISSENLNNYRILSVKRTDDGVSTSYGICMQLATAPAEGVSKIKIRTDTQPHGAAQTTANGFNKSLNNSAGRETTLDVWHHFAIIYTYAEPSESETEGKGHMVFAIDGLTAIEGDLMHPLTFDGLAPTIELGDRIIASYDLVRVTPRARALGELMPNETTYVRGPAITEPTLAWWRFENGTAGEAATAQDVVSTSNATLWTANRTGSVVYSDDVSHKTNVTDVAGSKDPAHFLGGTARSMSFSGASARLYWGNSPALYSSNMTFEAFYRYVDGSSMTTFARLNREKHAQAGQLLLWTLQCDAQGRIRVRADSVPPEGVEPKNGDNYNQVATGTTNINDGRWHHVALTYEAESNLVKAYVDYECEATLTPKYQLPIERATNFVIGHEGNSTLVYRLDECRLSAGVLPTDRFLRLVGGPSGLMLILR